MNFKPIDEMSLRQLFSTEFAKDILNMSYIGPVLNQMGRVDPSPDALILDMRKSPYRVLRCEFKFQPKSKDAFKDNGKFDIAIVWSIESPMTKEVLTRDLYEQNGCKEIIVCDESSKFHKLPDYEIENIERNFNVESIKNNILKNRSGISSVMVIYIAAKNYPARINSEKMLEMLMQKYPKLASIPAKGRNNVVGTFIQTSPPLLKRMYGQVYEWNSDFDSVIGSAVIGELITVNYRENLPTEEEMRYVLEA